MNRFLEEAAAIEDWMIALRHDIHRHPEMGRHEHVTAKRVEDELRAMGIPTRRMAETGVVGDLQGALPGRRVAIRADMDALPIQERTGLPFASECPGVMHACGHDMHTAALLGAARLLSMHRDALRGGVRFLFQPDEEGDGGAQRMIDDGCLDGVDAAFGAHVASDLPVGTIDVRYGNAYASSNMFDIAIYGKGSHGAAPHLGIDAIPAACAVVAGLQTLVSRELSPLEPAVITVGSFHAGTARNVLADEAHLSGIIRCFGAETRERLSERVAAMARETAAAHGCQAEVQMRRGYDGIVNDDAMTRLVQDAATELLGAEAVRVKPSPNMGTEDFGALLNVVPGSFWHLGVGVPGRDNPPGHSPLFNPDESALRTAAALHAWIAWKYLAQ